MKNQLCLDFANHYKTTSELLRRLMKAFSEEQWHTGVSDFETPVNLAYHTIECMDYYFRNRSLTDFKFGYRYGGSWWQLAENKKPSVEQLLDYLGEIEERIITYFEGSEDSHLYEE